MERREGIESKKTSGAIRLQIYQLNIAAGSKTLQVLAQPVCVPQHMVQQSLSSSPIQTSQLQASHSSCQLIGSSAPSTLRICPFAHSSNVTFFCFFS